MLETLKQAGESSDGRCCSGRLIPPSLGMMGYEEIAKVEQNYISGVRDTGLRRYPRMAKETYKMI